MRMQSILTLTDFSSQAEHGLDRAAALAAAHGAQLRILYACETPPLQLSDPVARLEQRARQLGRRHGLPVTALHGAGQGVVADALQAAAQADLLVLDRRMQSGWHAWWRPCVLAQLLRRAPCPVLVVQQPAQGAYGHVLVALDAAPAVPALLRYAGALEGSARVELFQPCPVRGPCDATLAYRSQEQWRVRLSDAFEARRNRVDLRVGGQDLARQLVVQQERVGADLIVLGHRRRGLLTETLRGAVARRLLQGVRCDVLVVPHDGASQPQERRQAVAAPGWG